MNRSGLVSTLTPTAPSWSSVVPLAGEKKLCEGRGGSGGEAAGGGWREASSEDCPHSYLLSIPTWLDAEPVIPHGSTGPELRGHKVEHPSSLSWGLA